MLTPEQQAWVESRSDTKTITIVPYDERTEVLFEKVRVKIIDLLETGTLAEHCGASSFGISGQDEIDVSIVATKEQFDDYVYKLEQVFGPARPLS